MEEREKTVSEMDSAPVENKFPQESTFELNVNQDDSLIPTTAGPRSTASLPSTSNGAEISATKWEFVTYREIPYEPAEFWDELRNQTPVQNIVITSSRLRAINPRILADFDENADKVLMEHDETEISRQDSFDNEDDAFALELNQETAPINSNRRKSYSSYRNSDSEIESPESVSFEDSDFSLRSSLSSDSDSSVSGWSTKARERRARRRRRTNRIDSSSESSDLSDEIFCGRKSKYDEFSLGTTSITDLSVSGISSDSDDDLFTLKDI